MDSPPPPSKSARLRSALQVTVRQTRDGLLTINRHNLRTLRSQPLLELSGSFGDLGTLLPLLIALTTSHSISLSSTLVFSGLANIFTGLCFGIPLPVQPMKAIAAVAIAEEWDPDVTVSAGLFVAGTIGALSVTGTLRWVSDRVPVAVVKGIQVGTGLSLAVSAGGMYNHGPGHNAILALTFIALLLSAGFKRLPFALLVLVIGISCSAFPFTGDENWPSGFGIWRPHTSVPSEKAFVKGMLEAGIGQLPLTALNSVVAVTFLAQDLLPEVSTPSVTAIGSSVAGINLVGCWFGAMPVCHGSGGLAAQYKFGARSGASVVLLGLLKLILGLFANKVALCAFLGFPKVLLCVLVIAAGLELAKVGESLNTEGARDLFPPEQMNGNTKVAVELPVEERMRRWTVMLVTVVGIMAFHNTAVGFLAGMLCFWSQQLRDVWENRQRAGRIRLDGA